MDRSSAIGGGEELRRTWRYGTGGHRRAQRGRKLVALYVQAGGGGSRMHVMMGAEMGDDRTETRDIMLGAPGRPARCGRQEAVDQPRTGRGRVTLEA